MKKANYIILDCETGGLNPSKNPITQVAFLTIDGITLEEIDRYESYVAPYKCLKIEKAALDATGLKISDINSGLNYKQAVKMMKAYFKKAKAGNHPSLKPVIIGHNIPFDIGFLQHIFRLVGEDDLYNYVNNIFIDTMALSKMYNPKAKSLKLVDCCTEVGIDLPDAHKAMNDVVATTDLFRTYCKNIKNVGKNNVKTKSKEKSRIKFQF